MSPMAHVVLKSQYVNGVTFSMIGVSSVISMKKERKTVSVLLTRKTGPSSARFPERKKRSTTLSMARYCRKAQVVGAETEVSKRVLS